MSASMPDEGLRRRPSELRGGGYEEEEARRCERALLVLALLLLLLLCDNKAVPDRTEAYEERRGTDEMLGPGYEVVGGAPPRAPPGTLVMLASLSSSLIGGSRPGAVNPSWACDTLTRGLHQV